MLRPLAVLEAALGIRSPEPAVAAAEAVAVAVAVVAT
jgi:hypothetical protein